MAYQSCARHADISAINSRTGSGWRGRGGEIHTKDMNNPVDSEVSCANIPENRKQNRVTVTMSYNDT